MKWVRAAALLFQGPSPASRVVVDICGLSGGSSGLYGWIILLSLIRSPCRLFSNGVWQPRAAGRSSYRSRWSIVISFSDPSGLIILWATMEHLARAVRAFVRQTRPTRDGQFLDIECWPPLWASWLAVALICAVCVWLLSRKVRAYEVIK